MEEKYVNVHSIEYVMDYLRDAACEYLSVRDIVRAYATNKKLYQILRHDEHMWKEISNRPRVIVYRTKGRGDAIIEVRELDEKTWALFSMAVSLPYIFSALASIMSHQGISYSTISDILVTEGEDLLYTRTVFCNFHLAIDKHYNRRYTIGDVVASKFFRLMLNHVMQMKVIHETEEEVEECLGSREECDRYYTAEKYCILKCASIEMGDVLKSCVEATFGADGKRRIVFLNAWADAGVCQMFKHLSPFVLNIINNHLIHRLAECQDVQDVREIVTVCHRLRCLWCALTGEEYLREVAHASAIVCPDKRQADGDGEKARYYGYSSEEEEEEDDNDSDIIEYRNEDEVTDVANQEGEDDSSSSSSSSSSGSDGEEDGELDGNSSGEDAEEEENDTRGKPVESEKKDDGGSEGECRDHISRRSYLLKRHAPFLLHRADESTIEWPKNGYHKAEEVSMRIGNKSIRNSMSCLNFAAAFAKKAMHMSYEECTIKFGYEVVSRFQGFNGEYTFDALYAIHNSDAKTRAEMMRVIMGSMCEKVPDCLSNKEALIYDCINILSYVEDPPIGWDYDYGTCFSIRGLTVQLTDRTDLRNASIYFKTHRKRGSMEEYYTNPHHMFDMWLRLSANVQEVVAKYFV